MYNPKSMLTEEYARLYTVDSTYYHGYILPPTFLSSVHVDFKKILCIISFVISFVPFLLGHRQMNIKDSSKFAS